MARSPDKPEVIDPDERLGEAIEAYLELAEQGQAPDPDAFAAEYPELSADLRAALDGLALVQGLVGRPDGPGRRLEAGHRIAGYRIIRELGRGGMGVVYEAHHVDLDRPVALKVLGTHATPDGRGRRRFLNEAKTAASLHHTHIVPVFDVGQVGGLCYYAMQRIEGSGLDCVLRSLRRDRATAAGSGTGRTPPQSTQPNPSCLYSDSLDSLAGTGSEVNASWTRSASPSPSPSSRRDDGPPPFTPPKGSGYHRWVARVGRQAAEALAYAHRRGVVHRDIKPSNLLVDAKGTIWVADFGLARRLADPGQTHPESLLGTPRYMSPEQAEGKHLDGRTDVYSLGTTLYELLTLRPPFEGQTAADLIRQITGREPPSPRQSDARIPRDLETIILKAMAKRPQDRYASAADLAEDLDRFLEPEPVKARRIGPIGRFLRFSRRHPSLTAVTASAAAVILAVATVAYVRIANERDRALVAEGMTKEAIGSLREALQRAEDLTKARGQEIVGRLLSEAELRRISSTIPNRRETGLALLRQAAEAGPDPIMQARLRDEAVAFLAMRDVESRFEVSSGPTWGMSFNQEGDRLASLSADGAELALWDLSRGHPLDAHRIRLRPVANEVTEGEGEETPPIPIDFRFYAGQYGVGTVGPLLATVRPNNIGVRLLDPSSPEAFLRDLRTPGWQIISLLTAPGGDRLVTVERSRPRPGPRPANGPGTGEPGTGADRPRPGPGPGVEGAPGPGRTRFQVRLWDLTDGDEPLAVLLEPQVFEGRGGGMPVLSAIDPDGRIIALGLRREKRVELFDAEDGRRLGIIEDEETEIELNALALGSDGLLAIAGRGEIRFWNLGDEGPSPLTGLTQYEGFVGQMRFSPDGALLAVTGGGPGIELWAPASNSLLAVLPTPGSVQALEFSPDSRLLVAAAGESILGWGIVEPVGHVRFSGFEGYPLSLAFSPEGTLAIATQNGPARFWKVRHCASRAEEWETMQPTGLAFDHRGLMVAVDEHELLWYPHSCDAPVRSIELPRPWTSRGNRVQILDLTPDGRRLVLSRSSQLMLWDAAEPDQIAELSLPEFGSPRSRLWVSAGALSPAGDHLYLIVGPDNELLVLALDGQRLRSLGWSAPGRFFCLALSPDGRTLALGGENGEISLLDTFTGTLRTRFSLVDGSNPLDKTEPPNVTALAFSPEGNELAIGTDLGRIHLWSVNGPPTRLIRLPGHRGRVALLAFDTEGRHLASADGRFSYDEREVGVWDLSRVRQELERLKLGW
ncbi:hypothetical protein BH23PLA1_BH23PLA1_14670 [soil metagenome]